MRPKKSRLRPAFGGGALSLILLLATASLAVAATGSNVSFDIDENAYCNDGAGPWWNPGADDEAEVATEHSGQQSMVRADSPDSSYFYFSVTTWHKGKDADGAAHANSPVARVAGIQNMDMYLASWGPPGDYTVDDALWDNRIDVQYDGGYNVVEVETHYRWTRNDAGELGKIRTACLILSDGAGGTPEEKLTWAVWLSKVEADLTGNNKVDVDWDAYTDIDFDKYEVYYKKEADSTWTLGDTVHSKSTSSTDVGPLNCYTTYDFKVRLVFDGTESWENPWTETYLESEYISTCSL